MLADGLPFRRETCLELTGRRPYRLVAQGLIRELVRGVYVDSAASDSVALRARAVSLVLPPDAVLCRGTVAWLDGIGDVRLPSATTLPVPAVECVVPVGRMPARRLGVRCFAADLRPEDVVEVGGLLRTSGLRTAVDLGRWLPRPMALAALDAMAGRQMFDVDQALDALQHRFKGHRGVQQAKTLVTNVEPLTESFGESWLRLRILDAGFPRPEAQIEMLDEHGRQVFRLDLGYRARRLGLEFDGQEAHGSLQQMQHDEWRRDTLRRCHGWEVLAFHRGHIWGASMELERAVGEALGLEPQLTRRRW